jgi:type I restriction enzyme S subunit
MLKRGRTTSGLYNLSVGRIKTIEVPLPSLTEQRRIVAKVESLLSLCDALAAQVVGAEEVRQRLLQVVLNGG